MKKLLFILLLFKTLSTFSQTGIEILFESKGLSFRGLSVVSDEIFWVSGNNGTVGKSIDGGKTFEWLTVPGFEKSDFRDIEAFDKNTAIIMAIAEPAYILKTIDGGKIWKIVYENHQKGMFLDAMDFDHKFPKEGIVVGDAVEGKIFLLKTSDMGDTWREFSDKPASIEKEGCFASSGTNIILFDKHYYLVTGGKNSRFFKNGIAKQIPIIQGTETTGANSIAISKNRKNIIIVGGDFSAKNENIENCLISKNGGKTYAKSKSNPFGYRSCVIFLNEKTALTCGLNGVDVSKDKGFNWLNISNESFHVCQKASIGKVIYFAGANGRVGKMVNPFQ